MDCTSTKLPYGLTGYFSKIVVDYIDKAPALDAYYEHSVSKEGIRLAIEARKKKQGNRSTLVKELQKQYANLHPATLVEENISKLASENTFTICTAHQPCIFTGTLFFVYKILHTIKLATECKRSFPELEKAISA